MKESSLPSGPAALPPLSLRSPSTPQGPPAPRPGPGRSGRARTEVSRGPRHGGLTRASVARVGAIDRPGARRPPPGALGVARAWRTGRGGRGPWLPPGGWWGQLRSESQTRPALLFAGAPLRSRSAPPSCRPGAGPQVPSTPHPSAPAGSGPSVRVRASRARRAGGSGRPGRGTERCHRRVWAEKLPPPHQPPGARGRRGLQPGARVLSEPWRQLEFCVSGELAELLALCWEFRGYCGHPGEGSSLHLDRDATETSHRFLPSCEWSLPVRSGDGVCELDGISALSSSAFKQVPRL